jgi:hypothetical protein
MATQAVSPVVNADQVTVSSSAPTTVYVGNPVLGIQVKSLLANTGLIYIGGLGVSSTKCYPLSPGESLFLPLADTSQLKALAAVNNEKLHYVVF